jgi:hypothetical protein
MIPSYPAILKHAPYRMIVLGIALFAINTFALSGTVKTSAEVAVRGAKVSLVSDTSVKATTDNNGAFTLNPSTALFHPGNLGTAAHTIERLGVRDGKLHFSLLSPARKASVRVFSTDGAQRFSTAPTSWDAGSHQIGIPQMSPGLYTVRFALDGRTTVRQILLTGISGQSGQSGDGINLQSTPSDTRQSLARRSEVSAAAAATAAVDTLLVQKFGYVPTKTPVTSYSQTGLSIVAPLDTVSLLPSVTNYSVDGPYTTVVETNVGPGSAYTIYRPDTLGANGFLHAPIIYGHGISSQVSTFAPFLRSVASHGFVIIACNVLTGGPNNAGNTSAMNNGLNWILQQDTTTGSKFKGKLAVTRAASMGYSVGGTAAVDIGAHPALLTVVSIHGHISKATLHGSLLQTSGTLDNVGLPMQQQTYDSSDVPTFLGTVTGANHGYIQNNNGGVQRPAIVAWLRYRIYNDHGAKPYFYGPTCTLCTAPWENPQRKNWD